MLERRQRLGLILGWKLGETLEPEAWLREREIDLPHPDTDDDLVAVRQSAMGAHACIVAQSGSGKSFFLGRLLEELLIATRANLVILDPNADFCRFHEVIEDHVWSPPKYDRTRRIGRLPTEPSTCEFAGLWEQVSFHLHTNRGTVHSPSVTNCRRHKVVMDWPRLKDEFFCDRGYGPEQRTRLQLVHRFATSVLQAVAQRRLEDALRNKQSVEYVDLDFDVVRSLVGASVDQLRKVLQFPAADVPRQEYLNQSIDTAALLLPHVSHEQWNSYLGIFAVHHADELVRNRFIHDRADDPARVQVIDLASIGDPQKESIVATYHLGRTLERAKMRWSAAISNPATQDHRRPTFVVIEEAHRLLPRTGEEQVEGQAATRAAVREIAAEGRKLGVFLILVSQRPEKLDPWVLGEIENVALMRLGSTSVVESVIDAFGLQSESRRRLDRVLEFPKSRALMLGSWSGHEPVTLCSAMRRTVEGGRSLQDGWHMPLEPPDPGEPVKTDALPAPS